MRLYPQRILAFPRQLMKDLGRDEGWTFIEIIVVLAIILILSGAIGIVAFQQLGRASVASTRDQMQSYALALNAYAMDNNSYPSVAQGLEALTAKPGSEPLPKNWKGPYLDKKLGADGWGHPFVYQMPGPNGLPFGLSSLGADNQAGGEGDNADINSWE